jgi:hypothetical protein
MSFSHLFKIVKRKNISKEEIEILCSHAHVLHHVSKLMGHSNAREKNKGI